MDDRTFKRQLAPWVGGAGLVLMALGGAAGLLNKTVPRESGLTVLAGLALLVMGSLMEEQGAPSSGRAGHGRSEVLEFGNGTRRRAEAGR
ncbi:hypothetical protein HY375_03860 [Candidatus Berkelbacteria bacterium]|nr:hypothetical protein [Candidatus Berkelbacteria bacterium]